MNTLIEHWNRRGKFLCHANDSCFTPACRERNHEHSKRLASLVLPHVLTAGLQFALKLRIDGTAHNRDPQVATVYTVAVLRIVDDGQAVLLAAAIARYIN